MEAVLDQELERVCQEYFLPHLLNTDNWTINLPNLLACAPLKTPPSSVSHSDVLAKLQHMLEERDFQLMAEWAPENVDFFLVWSKSNEDNHRVGHKLGKIWHEVCSRDGDNYLICIREEIDRIVAHFIADRDKVYRWSEDMAPKSRHTKVAVMQLAEQTTGITLASDDTMSGLAVMKQTSK